MNVLPVALKPAACLLCKKSKGDNTGSGATLTTLDEVDVSSRDLPSTSKQAKHLRSIQSSVLQGITVMRRGIRD
jgi:hypothetical protein